MFFINYVLSKDCVISVVRVSQGVKVTNYGHLVSRPGNVAAAISRVSNKKKNIFWVWVAPEHVPVQPGKEGNETTP